MFSTIFQRKELKAVLVGCKGNENNHTRNTAECSTTKTISKLLKVSTTSSSTPPDIPTAPTLLSPVSSMNSSDSPINDENRVQHLQPPQNEHPLYNAVQCEMKEEEKELNMGYLAESEQYWNIHIEPTIVESIKKFEGSNNITESNHNNDINSNTSNDSSIIPNDNGNGAENKMKVITNAIAKSLFQTMWQLNGTEKAKHEMDKILRQVLLNDEEDRAEEGASHLEKKEAQSLEEEEKDQNKDFEKQEEEEEEEEEEVDEGMDAPTTTATTPLLNCHSRSNRFTFNIKKLTRQPLRLKHPQIKEISFLPRRLRRSSRNILSNNCQFKVKFNHYEDDDYEESKSEVIEFCSSPASDVTGAGAEGDSTASECFDKGCQLWHDLKYDYALEELRKSLKIQELDEIAKQQQQVPTKVDTTIDGNAEQRGKTHYSLGMVYLSQSRHDLALIEFRRSFRLFFLCFGMEHMLTKSSAYRISEVFAAANTKVEVMSPSSLCSKSLRQLNITSMPSIAEETSGNMCCGGGDDDDAGGNEKMNRLDSDGNNDGCTKSSDIKSEIPLINSTVLLPELQESGKETHEESSDGFDGIVSHDHDSNQIVKSNQTDQVQQYLRSLIIAIQHEQNGDNAAKMMDAVPSSRSIIAAKKRSAVGNDCRDEHYKKALCEYEAAVKHSLGDGDIGSGKKLFDHRNHPDIAILYEKIGTMHSSYKKEWKQASVEYAKALTIYTSMYDFEHHYTIRCLKNFVQAIENSSSSKSPAEK